MKKEDSATKPWSNDPVFRTTYFCNVRREDDKVTKWIRKFFEGDAENSEFEYNIAVSRFINWPDTLDRILPLGGPATEFVAGILNSIEGKVFGDAYIVSTCGRQMPKAKYLTEILLPAVYERLGAASGWRAAYGGGPLARAYAGLINVFGISDFMAGQIIADLKNTLGHPLANAKDWWTWCTPGPGSLRGLSWIRDGRADGNIPKRNFFDGIAQVRAELFRQGCGLVNTICNQDLQNCLCEFDKYCRVSTGSGRSKRKYNGT